MSGRPPVRPVGVTELAAKILVVGPSWVGDMVMSQVLYRSLLQSRPGVVIDVLTPAWSGPLLQRMPEVRRSITMPLHHGELGLARRWRLGRALRDEQYEQAIVLPNSLKSALTPWFARIPRRTGWRGELRYGLVNDLRVLDKMLLPQMVQRFVALGLSLGAVLPADLPEPHLAVNAQAAEDTGRRFGLDSELPVLALCPGAEFGEAKRWPPEYYADIARDYLSGGWQVVLYGSVRDREVCGRIHHDSGAVAHCHDLAGRTTLAEVVDLLSLSAAVVSNDSGLMHIAAALHRPLLVVYGPTSPVFTPPLSAAASHIEVGIDCAPCFARNCPLGHHRCMRDISPSDVTVKLEILLARNGGEH